MGGISQRRRFGGVREGIAQLPQGRESPLHRGIDQPQTLSKSNLRAKGSQGSVWQEQPITTAWWWVHQGLKQVLQCGIDPGDADQNCPAAALFQHLKGDAPGG